SSPSPRWSTSSATWACGWPRAARARAASSTTCSASAASTRSRTACLWSGSCHRCAARFRTSTSTLSRRSALSCTSGSTSAVVASWLGFPKSQFDKDDVEDLGLLKLDVLGIRMQSAMSQAVQEVRRVDDVEVDLDAIPLDDPATYELIRSTHTLGCFQIESPG